MIQLIRSPRALALLAAVLVVCVAAVLTPLPGPARVQEWAGSVGPLFPLLFFVVYALVTIAPVPRTVLTVSCGVLFGVGLGLTVALAATTVSAALALLLVRRLDGRRVAARLTHPAVRAVDERLRRRGWLAVWSLRMISFAPFSVVNYCCALSSIRVTPYLVATTLGSLPGTAATVILADALVSGASPEMIAVSAGCLLMGVAGLVLDSRWRPAGESGASGRDELGPVAEAGESTAAAGTDGTAHRAHGEVRFSGSAADPPPPRATVPVRHRRAPG